MELPRLTASLLPSVIILIVLFCAGWTKTEQAKTVAWEYKHMALSTSREAEYDNKLSQLGSEGWELTAVDREQPGGLVHFYLKRAK